MIRTYKYLFMAIAILTAISASAKRQADDMVIVAYVTSWTNEVPDPTTMTLRR